MLCKVRSCLVSVMSNFVTYVMRRRKDMMSKTLGGGKFVYYTEKSLMLCNVRSWAVGFIENFLPYVM